MIIIDSRMRSFEKEALKNIDNNLFEILPDKNLYYEISSHVDIHFCKIKNSLICSPNNYIKNFKKGFSNLSNKYPYDICYNVCIVGNFAIHNFKYTDPKILEILDKENLKKIFIKQGYSKCSIAVIDSNSVILTDKKIAETLYKNNINVLLLNEAITSKIKLYKNQNFEYSTMNGFIGGCISRIDNNIFISGDLNKIDPENKIRNFIQERNLNIIDFKEKDVIDYGGILKV